MNKTSAKGLLLPLVMASASVFVGCTNNDYDFNEIDLTLGLGGNELVIPTSSTKEIALDDILKLNEGDCVKILDNGDYVFTQEGAEVDEVHPSIEKVTLLQASDPQSFDFNIDDALRSALPADVRSKKAADGFTFPINLEQEVLKFEYEATQPEILSLTSADVTINLGLSVNFSPNLAQCIGTFDELTIQLPSYMVVDGVEGNVLKLNNVSTNDGININVNVSKLDFSNNDGLVISEGGHMHLTGNLVLGIKTNVEITSDKLQYLNNCYLSSSMVLDAITINGAKGKFDPKIDLNDLGDVEVSGTPDFLKDDAVVIDLANPQILVEINSDLDVAAKINANLVSTKGETTLKTLNINGIKIHPNTLTQICICRDASKVNAAYAGYDKYEVADLSELIRTIPDRIKFGATTKVDNTDDSSFELSHEYHIKPSYSIIAPIAFGKDANIVYTDSIDGMHDDIDGLELAKDAYLEVTADVANKLPVFLDTKVTPLGVDGNDLSSLVNVIVENNIPAADKGETATGTLKITVRGDVKQLDKLKFTIGGKASDGDNSVTGVTLNKNEHSLKLYNISAKLVGKIIYDAN